MALLDEWGNPIEARRFAHGARRGTGSGPDLRTRDAGIDRLIPAHDRKTLSALSRRIIFNAGPAKEAIRQKASYSVGGAYLPQYLGPDRDAGEIVEDWLVENFLPRVDRRGGGRDWWQFLQLASKGMDRDGEHFALFTRHDDGMPALQHLPPHTVRSELADDQVRTGTFDGARLVDGVLYGSAGEPIAFRVYRDDRADRDFQDIGAQSLVHTYDDDFVDQGRGYPAFAHALFDLKNGMTSKELETIRQNLVSAIYAVEKHGDDGIDEDDPRYEGRTAAAGRGFLYEEIRPGIRHMSADEDLQLVTHHAPGSVWSEFQDRLWREAIVGAGWALALVWKAPQQGTANRAEELRARLAVGARQKVLDILARRVISYAAAVGAELGEVPALRSARWAFSRPARLSLDDGREANAELAAVEAGQMSVSQYQAARGRTARQHFEELARERELKLEILGSDEDGSD